MRLFSFTTLYRVLLWYYNDLPCINHSAKILS